MTVRVDIGDEAGAGDLCRVCQRSCLQHPSGACRSCRRGKGADWVAPRVPLAPVVEVVPVLTETERPKFSWREQGKKTWNDAQGKLAAAPATQEKDMPQEDARLPKAEACGREGCTYKSDWPPALGRHRGACNSKNEPAKPPKPPKETPVPKQDPPPVETPKPAKKPKGEVHLAYDPPRATHGTITSKLEQLVEEAPAELEDLAELIALVLEKLLARRKGR